MTRDSPWGSDRKDCFGDRTEPEYGYFTAMRKYVRLDGRSPRREFWLYQLGSLIVAIAALTLDQEILPYVLSHPPDGLFYNIVSAAHFLPGLAVSVRRMHDIGMSGAWVLILLVPIVGLIVFFIWSIRKSDRDHNKYGQHPYATVE